MYLFVESNVKVLDEAVEFMVSALFLGTAITLGLINTMHLPPIILEIARLFAYLGASMAFFKFLYSVLTYNKNKDKK
jgi:hypothetical protein